MRRLCRIQCREQCKTVRLLNSHKTVFCQRNAERQSNIRIFRCSKSVNFCKQIYHEEDLLEELTAEERKVKPLADAFFAWLEAVPVSGKSKLAEAVRYTKNEKTYLYTFLQDGNVAIDNNRAENAIRPFAIGRKNWLFSNTENGANSSAALYSIISTAQSNGLDVECYLT